MKQITKTTVEADSVEIEIEREDGRLPLAVIVMPINNQIQIHFSNLEGKAATVVKSGPNTLVVEIQ